MQNRNRAKDLREGAKTVSLRLLPEERLYIHRVAEDLGITASQWARSTLLADYQGTLSAIPFKKHKRQALSEGSPNISFELSASEYEYLSEKAADEGRTVYGSMTAALRKAIGSKVLAGAIRPTASSKTMYSFEVSVKERELLTAAAEADGVSVRTWIREVVLVTAKRRLGY